VKVAIALKPDRYLQFLKLKIWNPIVTMVYFSQTHYAKG